MNISKNLKFRPVYYLIAIIFTNSFNLFSNDNKSLGIIPQPKEIEILSTKSYFNLSNNVEIGCSSLNSASAEYLKKIIFNSTGFDLKVSKNGLHKPTINTILLIIDSTLNLNKDGYELFSNKKYIVVKGKTDEGLFWGIQTLLQLFPPEIYSTFLRKGIDWKIPSVKIKDEPLFTEFRGVHIDIARHFRTKEEILETIDLMALHKMNKLHIHFEDDQGWRIESKIYPNLHKIGAIGDIDSLGVGKSYYLKQSDVKEIVQYAKTRFIRVFPEVDMPGHMHSVIRSYPELASKADKRNEKKVIRIDKEGEVFCKNILKEIDGLFDSEEIHLGFDEINYGLKKDIYNDEEIVEFAKIITEFVKKNLGKTPILWDDVFQKGFEDKNSIANWWRYGKEHWWKDLDFPLDAMLLKINQPMILSPANYVYLDMVNVKGEQGAGWAGAISVAQIYAWDPLGDLTNYDDSKKHLVKGIICPTWSESISSKEEFERRLYPRLAAISEKCWATSSNGNYALSWEDYRDYVLQKQLKRYAIFGLNYWSLLNPNKLMKLKAEKK